MQPSAIVEARATEVNLGMHSKDKDKDKYKDKDKDKDKDNGEQGLRRRRGEIRETGRFLRR